MEKIKVRDTMRVSEEIHHALLQWAKWTRANPDLCLGYPDMTPYQRLLGARASSPLITDDEAMKIDAKVAELRKRYPKPGKAVVLYYFLGCNLSRVARKMNVYNTKADLWIKIGSAWLDAALIGS